MTFKQIQTSTLANSNLITVTDFWCSKVFKSNKRPVNQIAKTAGINQGTRYTDLQPILSLHFVLEIGNIIRHSHCCSSCRK
jgi:hypothetical protein